MLRSVMDAEFTSTLEAWLQDHDELLVMFRYPYAGGARDYELHSSMETIVGRLSVVPAQTSVIAFRQPQLKIRGVVTESFINAALSSIPDGLEFLIVEMTPTVLGSQSWYRDASGERHSELREELETSMGRPVILGTYPPWLQDGPDVISGFVPDRNGDIKPGAY